LHFGQNNFHIHFLPSPTTHIPIRYILKMVSSALEKPFYLLVKWIKCLFVYYMRWKIHLTAIGQSCLLFQILLSTYESLYPSNIFIESFHIHLSFCSRKYTHLHYWTNKKLYLFWRRIKWGNKESMCVFRCGMRISLLWKFYSTKKKCISLAYNDKNVLIIYYIWANTLFIPFTNPFSLALITLFQF
jgi:hypothetical protein